MTCYFLRTNADEFIHGFINVLALQPHHLLAKAPFLFLLLFSAIAPKEHTRITLAAGF